MFRRRYNDNTAPEEFVTDTIEEGWTEAKAKRLKAFFDYSLLAVVWITLEVIIYNFVVYFQHRDMPVEYGGTQGDTGNLFLIMSALSIPALFFAYKAFMAPFEKE